MRLPACCLEHWATRRHRKTSRLRLYPRLPLFRLRPRVASHELPVTFFWIFRTTPVLRNIAAGKLRKCSLVEIMRKWPNGEGRRLWKKRAATVPTCCRRGIESKLAAYGLTHFWNKPVTLAVY